MGLLGRLIDWAVGTAARPAATPPQQTQPPAPVAPGVPLSPAIVAPPQDFAPLIAALGALTAQMKELQDLLQQVDDHVVGLLGNNVGRL